MTGTRPNVVYVMTDTLRTAYLGCYGNEAVRTPNIDRFAAWSVMFTRAYPESLPTIPVRRAIHTGRRAYPFRDYAPVPWDIVYLPGWQAMDRTEDTLAENLANVGYHTGFVTDTIPYFAPGFNFQRGFWQWNYVRGLQQDRWGSVNAVDDGDMAGYWWPGGDAPKHSNLRYHVANSRGRLRERDTTTAEVFSWAIDFLEDNRNAEPFYLMIDSFRPHEPWEAPLRYYQMYADPDYDGPTIPHARYQAMEEQGIDEAMLQDLVAQYCGLVSLVDTWFGMLMDTLERLDLLDNTMVIFTSDHGTHFADNPQGVVGKPAYSLWPGVMHLPLLVRNPGGAHGRCVENELVYNLDTTATIYDVAGIDDHQPIDGQSLVPLLGGGGEWRRREYVTSRYNDAICYIDDEWWIRTDVDGEPGEAFHLPNDPFCDRDLVNELPPDVYDRAWDRILADAGGDLPVYDNPRRTDAVGLRY
ncbi:MAG: sulfatase-like hydrolase/transferase [Armatimonadia bacterium]|nr:sulfatase-like hydrolase/transferase [Armatimonadia bacterium]